MIYTKNVIKCINFAEKYAKDLKDEADLPLFQNILHIAEHSTSEAETIVSLLFAFVMKDKKYLDDIRWLNLGEVIEKALILFVNDEKDYFEYIKSIKLDNIACVVMKKNLKQLLDKTRYINGINEEDEKKYRKSLEILSVGGDKKDYRKEKDKYFEFYDDLKSHRHRVYDW